MATLLKVHFKQLGTLVKTLVTANKDVLHEIPSFEVRHFRVIIKCLGECTQFLRQEIQGIMKHAVSYQRIMIKYPHMDTQVLRWFQISMGVCQIMKR